MQTSSSPLLPLFKSRGLTILLSHLFTRADETAETVSDLAYRLGLSQSAISRDLDTLEEAGIIDSGRVGRARIVKLSDTSPYVQSLGDLIFAAFGPRSVLAQELLPVRGVRQAFIYGSWAARYRGEPGSQPNDIDVLVVGDSGIDTDAVYDTCSRASGILGREVNPMIISEAEWESSSSAFLRTLRNRPLVELAPEPRG